MPPIDAESLSLAPSDIIAFGEDSGEEPAAIASALQAHRDNIASWAGENVKDPDEWWRGVQQLDIDTAEGLQKMRTAHLETAIATALPDKQERETFAYELQASGFDVDVLPDEFKPAIESYKAALSDTAFQPSQRKLNGRIQTGDRTLAYFDMVDSGEDDKTIDAIVKFPVQDGETISERIAIKNATAEDARKGAEEFQKQADEIKGIAERTRNQKTPWFTDENALYSQAVGAEQFDAQAAELQSQADYLKKNGRMGMITLRVKEALKEPGRIEKLGQGLGAGIGGEFLKGLAGASIDLGILNQRIQGDEAELKQLVAGKEELGTAIEGASRTEFGGNLLERGIASGTESLGAMAPLIAGGMAARGLSSAAGRAAMDTGRLGVVGAGMGLESAGAAYGEAEQLAQAAEKAGDADKAARIRAGRDLYAITQAITETATERIGRLNTLKASGKGVRSLAKDMIQEGPVEEGVAGLLQGGITRPTSLGENPDVSQVPEAMIGGMVASVPLGVISQMTKDYPAATTVEGEMPFEAPPAPEPAGTPGATEAAPPPPMPPPPAAEAPPAPGSGFVTASVIAQNIGGPGAAQQIAKAQALVDSMRTAPPDEAAPVPPIPSAPLQLEERSPESLSVAPRILPPAPAEIPEFPEQFSPQNLRSAVKLPDGSVVVGEFLETHADVLKKLPREQRNALKISDIGYANSMTGKFLSEKEAVEQLPDFNISPDTLREVGADLEAKTGGEYESRRGGMASEELVETQRQLAGIKAEPTRKGLKQKPRIQTAFEEHPTIQKLVGEVGKMMSKTQARKAGVYNQNKELWDDLPSFASPTHSTIWGGNKMPDVAASEMGFESVGEMYRAIESASKNAVTVEQNEIRLKQQEAEAIAADKDFTKNALTRSEGMEEITLGEFPPGQTFTIKGEPVTLESFDEDDNAVLTSAKWGRRSIPHNQSMFVDPVATPEDGGEFLSPEELESRRRAPTQGQQTDMFAGTKEEPFNLIAETAEERKAREDEEARVAKRKADEEKERARVEAEKAQMGFAFEEELSLSTETEANTNEAWERAQDGDETAFDDMDAAFRERFPPEQPSTESELQSQARVFTPKSFETLFNRAFADKDFDAILEAVKQSDKGVWVPFLKQLFRDQADNPEAAAKAEWMRHVMAGTRPADAKAPASKPPPSATASSTSTPPPRSATSSTPPPKKPKASKPPPPPPPKRIPVAPIVGGKAKSPFAIIERFSRAIEKFLPTRSMKASQLGNYRPGSTRTASRFAGDLDTRAHEVGHWFDDKYGVGAAWGAGTGAPSPYDTELEKFWIHGSPAKTLKIRRAEGIAEFVRAYVMNPAAAVAQAPKFAKFFESKMPKQMMDALNEFSDDVRTWAGESPLRRAALNVNTLAAPTLYERLRKAIVGDAREFSKSFVDKMRSWFDDSYHHAVKGWITALKMQGKTPDGVSPRDNFDMWLRILSSHDARLSDQLENGLIPLNPREITNAKGELAVERITDPVTGRAMNLEWLLEPFDNSSQAAQDQDMREASAVMVAQRTLEAASKFDKEAARQIAMLKPTDPNLAAKTAAILRDAEKRKEAMTHSGLGAGMMSDYKAAQEAMDDLTRGDPLKARRLIEAARRYRLWADTNIDSYMVPSGRLSSDQAKVIHDENTQYVDMHRLSEEFDLQSRIERGVGSVGRTKDVIKRFKGSTLEVENVYKNLMNQTDAIQKEAIRNTTMRTFTKALESTRKLYEGDPVELDRIGARATEKDRNTVSVWNNGRQEYWKMDADIHEAVKGMGDLGSHAFVDLLALPQSVARYLITHSPAFMIRNPLRDATHRAVVSETGSQPWDVLQGYTKEEKSRLIAFGGGQFGNYAKDRLTWNRELKRAMRELRKDPRNIFLTPGDLKRAWERIAESSEIVGRVAEFRRAYKHGISKLGYSPEEAAMYAASQARGLIDYAKMGSVMRTINRLVPFSNAHLRGLARTMHSAKKDPAAFALRFSLYIVAPTLMVNALAHAGSDKDREEYLQLPAWQRDFFWNIKVGPHWIRIPKPHELGVMASGVERAVNKMVYGDKNAASGYSGSVANALLPIGSPVEATGPLKVPLEIMFNRSTFRDKDIIPPWEKDLKLELRKGTKYASEIGKLIGGQLNADPRFVDHFLQSYGGLGQMLTDFTSKEMRLGQAAAKATGLTTMPPSTQSVDYQWVADWAKQNGALGIPHMDYLRNLVEPVYGAATPEEADVAARRLRERATAIRNSIESGDLTPPVPKADKETLIPKGAYDTTPAMDKLADAGLFFGEPSAEGRKVDVGDVSRDMTPEERETYHKTVGAAFRWYAQQNLQILLKMPRKEAQAKIKEDAEMIRRLAVPKVGG